MVTLPVSLGGHNLTNCSNFQWCVLEDLASFSSLEDKEQWPWPWPWDKSPRFGADVRYSKLHPLMERLMCVPATSAPVERVLSHSGLFTCPHRATLTPQTLGQPCVGLMQQTFSINEVTKPEFDCICECRP